MPAPIVEKRINQKVPCAARRVLAHSRTLDPDPKHTDLVSRRARDSPFAPTPAKCASKSAISRRVTGPTLPAPTGRPSTIVIGMTCRFELVMKHSSQRATSASGSSASLTNTPLAAASAMTRSRVTPDSTAGRGRCQHAAIHHGKQIAARTLGQTAVAMQKRLVNAGRTRGPLRQEADERVERLRLRKVTAALEGDRRRTQRVVGRRIVPAAAAARCTRRPSHHSPVPRRKVAGYTPAHRSPARISAIQRWNVARSAGSGKPRISAERARRRKCAASSKGAPPTTCIDS